MRASTKSIAVEDLDRSVAKGIISAAQLDQIVAAVGSKQSDGPDARNDFNLPTVCYYLGALIIAFVYTYLVYRHWDALTYGYILGISIGTAAVLGGLGYFLRYRWHSPIAGDLLIFAAVALTPLAVYCVEQLTGFWPTASPGRYYGYLRIVHAGWIIMELATIAVSGLVLWWVRFPFLTAIPAHALLSGAEVRLPSPRTASFAGKAPALAEKNRKRAALPAGPTERGGPPPLSDSPRGLCGLF